MWWWADHARLVRAYAFEFLFTYCNDVLNVACNYLQIDPPSDDHSQKHTMPGARFVGPSLSGWCSWPHQVGYHNTNVPLKSVKSAESGARWEVCMFDRISTCVSFVTDAWGLHPDLVLYQTLHHTARRNSIQQYLSHGCRCMPDWKAMRSMNSEADSIMTPLKVVSHKKTAKLCWISSMLANRTWCMRCTVSTRVL